MESDIPIGVDENVLPEKKKRALAKSRLQGFITEALQIEKEKREAFAKRFPGVPPFWAPWPYLNHDAIASKVSKELGGLKESVKEILWRLRQFQYPYPVSNAQKPTTFYLHARAVGILEDLLKPPLLDDIQFFWWSQRYETYQKQSRTQTKSEYGHPMAFHSEFAYQLSTHLAEMDKLVKKYSLKKGAKSKNWFGLFSDYRRAALKQLLNEGAIIYPQIQYELKPARQIGTKEPKIAGQACFYEKFNSVIKKRSPKGRERHRFAYHLTSLICTPREIVRKRRLYPTPVTVRKNIEDLQK